MAGEHGFTGSKDVYNLASILQRLDNLEKGASKIKEVYPVGSIYMSVNNTNPSTFFGGTWVSWGEGRVPVGVGNGYSIGAQGGNASVTFKPTGGVAPTALGIRQIPYHSHRIWAVNRHISVQGGGGDGNYNALYTSSMHEVPTDVEVGWSENAYNGIGPDGRVDENNQAVGEAHMHGLSMNNTTIDVRQPYITCYMWKRTA